MTAGSALLDETPTERPSAMFPDRRKRALRQLQLRSCLPGADHAYARIL